MFRHPRRQPAFAAALVVLAFAAPARALADSAQCVAASERGQELKNAGKLTDARAELAICSRPECPKLVKDDCTKWMAQVLGTLPSIVPAAKDEAGHDVVEARLFVDDKLVTSTFDGKPIAIDPGVHALRFERNGAATIEERIVVKAGEQNRIISETLIATSASPPPPPASPSPPPPETPSAASAVPVAAIVIGGAGAVLAATALYMDLKTTAEAHDLRSSCAPSCAQADVNTLHARYVIAGVGAVIGVAALAVAGVLYFRQQHADVGMTASPLADAVQGRITF